MCPELERTVQWAKDKDFENEKSSESNCYLDIWNGLQLSGRCPFINVTNSSGKKLFQIIFSLFDLWILQPTLYVGNAQTFMTSSKITNWTWLIIDIYFTIETTQIFNENLKSSVCEEFMKCRTYVISKKTAQYMIRCISYAWGWKRFTTPSLDSRSSRRL